MKKFYTLLLFGFALIVLVDISGSIASKQMEFNYSNLFFLSFVIYTLIPFLIAKRIDKKSTIIAGGLLALFDATVGLKISMILKANTGDIDMNDMTVSEYLVVVLVMTLVGLIFGLLGYWLSRRIYTNEEIS